MEKSKLAKSLSSIVAMMFIIIGIAHLAVHFTDLTTHSVQEILDTTIPVMNNEESLWKMWQGYSFMMGICFMIIGLLVLIPILKLKQGEFPLIGHGFVMVLLLAAVSYSGYAFFTTAQLYGGIFGIVLQLGSLMLTVQHKIIHK